MSLRFVQNMVVNDIYTVYSLGSTTSGDWITSGACSSEFPNIGKQFKCLSNSITGTGVVKDCEINFLDETPITGITGTVAVSGPLTDAQLRVTAVPVSIASLDTTVVTHLNNTSGISLTEINLTSQQIKAAEGDIQTIVLTSDTNTESYGVNYVKLYNSATATFTNTPIFKIAIKDNQSISFTPNIYFSTGLCVRASSLWADSDVTAPGSDISGSFFSTN